MIYIRRPYEVIIRDLGLLRQFLSRVSDLLSLMINAVSLL
jgi:hypothetical protein